MSGKDKHQKYGWTSLLLELLPINDLLLQHEQIDPALLMEIPDTDN